MRLGLGRLGLSHVQQAGGGGGESYTAHAVHFDGSTWLGRASALDGVSNSPKFMFSVWLKSASVGVLAKSSPDNHFDIGADSPSGNVIAAAELFDSGVGEFLTATTDNTGSLSNYTWKQVLMSFDTTEASPDKRRQMLINGVDKFDPGSFFETGPGFSIDMTEAIFWVLGEGGDVNVGIVADVAQFYLCLGESLDLTEPANVAKFIVGGIPVDLLSSGAPAPTVLFDGNASTFGVNQGTGGAFTLTGSLTDAETSPGDAHTLEVIDESGNTEITEYVNNDVTEVTGKVDFSECPLFETFTAPLLRIIGGDVLFTDCGALSDIDFIPETIGGQLGIADTVLSGALDLSSLVSLGNDIGNNLRIDSNPFLTSIILTAFTGAGGGMLVANNVLLAIFSLPALLKPGGTDPNFSGNALDQASVDAILVRFAALDGTAGTTLWEDGVLDLSGGTNAVPSATGLAAKTTLEGRGCTVMVNE